MKKTMYISLLLAGCVLGIMLALQFRSSTSSVPHDRPQELTQELKQLEQDYQILQAEAADLENSLKQLEQGSSQTYEVLQNELQKLRFAAGLEEVTGPGVEVVMDNMPEKERSGYDPSVFSITYEDILRLVNELRAAGAKAISINGQRLVATSEIRNAGKFIDVNLTRLTTPYTIKAIGDPEKLASSLNIKGGIVDTLKEWSISVTVTPKEEITVPAYTNPLDFYYAKPLKEGEDE
ncbi:uncharacterized protein YlxW (UPF0749 family) [Desulfohalotomaculum tongense]|uniref:DUF881 domain-containing protein n=1 Tax=Desulforadius tongensis TaxID=1216062 RepID=UPI00195972B4|nr:DUF881 domain-containing protein [Desulforadius tongensis]MBM7855219.1 uncharacterized protein YlxW (UPF0749 family) [Desulforadius tongensis]